MLRRRVRTEPSVEVAGILASLDREALHAEAIALLQALLRIDTTNPPGNETAAVEHIRPLLEAEGITCEMGGARDARQNLVGRVKASAPAFEPGQKAALLLSGHLDVVPAERAKWTHDPFGGELHDGFIWGRGAIDMKNLVAMNVVTARLVARLQRDGKLRAARDLVIACVADEEAGCGVGSRWIAAHKPEWVRDCAFALNEVGGFTLHMGGERLYPIQVASKGFVWIRLRVRGEPGHGSMPHGDNAVVKLAEAIAKVGERLLPHHTTPVAQAFISAVAEAAVFPKGMFLRALLSPSLYATVERLLAADQRKFFRAALHNTVCPTMLASGIKENVIPGEAEAVLDCRILPGFTTETFLPELRALTGDAFDLEILAEGPPTTTPEETALMRILVDTLERRDEGGKAVPYLLVGFTDAIAWHELDIPTYGFAPVMLPPDLNFSAMFHGHDERILVDGFTWGLETYIEAVLRFLCEG